MNKSKSSPVRSQSPHGTLARQLERRFAAWRRCGGGAGRLVPPALRTAVMDALRAGVAGSDITSLCGVSRKQMQQWRSPEVQGDGTALVEPPARVLRVVDSVVEPCEAATEGIEIRVGGWCLTLNARR